MKSSFVDYELGLESRISIQYHTAEKEMLLEQVAKLYLTTVIGKLAGRPLSYFSVRVMMPSMS